jgi:pyruvate formate lyase activating enzyme
MKEALFYKKLDGKEGKVRCQLCPHMCFIPEGGLGHCQARLNLRGRLYGESYGEITSIFLDPIEKKPLKRFFPGEKILSVGSYGCNFRCGFCQNHNISMANKKTHKTSYISPADLVKKAIELVPKGNLGLAFTYNEPTVSYEYVLDCAMIAKENNLKTVLVTNGFICEKPLLELLPFIDAMNIDLKSFSPMFYRKIGGNIDAVKRTIEISVENCHVEITTLIIPDENDSEEEMHALSSWIAHNNDNTPLHVSRFFPSYRMTDKLATTEKKVIDLSNIARKYLKYFYEGNIVESQL